MGCSRRSRTVTPTTRSLSLLGFLGFVVFCFVLFPFLLLLRTRACFRSTVATITGWTRFSCGASICLSSWKRCRGVQFDGTSFFQHLHAKFEVVMMCTASSHVMQRQTCQIRLCHAG